MNSEHPLFVNLPRLLEAISDYPGNSTVRKVVCDVAQFANRYGTAFTTMRSVAARTGLSLTAVWRAYHIAEDTGLWDLTKEKKGLDRHPRDVAHFKRWFLRRHPDKQSSHYNASKWRRWCEIGRKRAITIKLKQKKTGTIRDTAAEMATRPIAASASPTPAQAREARQARGGGFAGFGGVLAGLFPTASSAATQPVVKDMYNAENQQRGDMLQALREHEAAAAMASQPTQPTAADDRERKASENRERKAQAYEELQQLRESLRRQPVPVPATDTTTAARMAARDVARDYRRSSRPAASPSRWPATTTQPVQLIQQPATTPAVEQDAQATRDYWKRKLREHEAQQAAAMGETR